MKWFYISIYICSDLHRSRLIVRAVAENQTVFYRCQNSKRRRQACIFDETKRVLRAVAGTHPGIPMQRRSHNLRFVNLIRGRGKNADAVTQEQGLPVTQLSFPALAGLSKPSLCSSTMTCNASSPCRWCFCSSPLRRKSRWQMRLIRRGTPPLNL